MTSTSKQQSAGLSEAAVFAAVERLVASSFSQESKDALVQAFAKYAGALDAETFNKSRVCRELVLSPYVGRVAGIILHSCAPSLEVEKDSNAAGSKAGGAVAAGAFRAAIVGNAPVYKHTVHTAINATQLTEPARVGELQDAAFARLVGQFADEGGVEAIVSPRIAP